MTISQELESILKKETSDNIVRMKDFTNHFGSRSVAFIIALLALPIALPFTPPGVNTPFAVVCIILAINIMMNKKNLELPHWIADKQIPFRADGRFFDAMTQMLKWVEKLVKPRISWVTDSKYSQPVLGFGVLCASIVMLIPLPIINSLSSVLVLLIAVGIVSKDGIVSIISTIAGILLLVVAIAVIVYGLYIGQSFFK